MKQRSKNDKKGKLGEDWVRFRVGQLGWGYTSTVEKNPSIDGFIQFPDPDSPSYLHVAVQVKSGPSQARFYKNNKHASIILDRDDVLDWQLSNVPIIVIWVEDPHNPMSKSLWGDTARVGRNSATLKVRKDAEFTKHALQKIVHIGKQHAGRPLVPVISVPPLFPTKVMDVRKVARQFYDDWRRSPTWSPVLGWVKVTLRGWHHVTRNTLGQQEIAHRLSLLPLARETLTVASRSQFVRKLQSDRGRIELHALHGLYRPSYRSQAIVEVIVQVRKRGHDVIGAKFCSVYERRRWR